MFELSILGSCITRDVFSKYKKDMWHINHHIHFASPLSLVETAVVDERLIPSLLVNTGSEFQRRCVCIDCKKDYLEILKPSPSDWLLMDVTNLRFDIVCFDDTKCTLTYTDAVRANFEALKNLFGSNYKIIRPYYVSIEDLYECARKYCSAVMQIYRTEKIILNEGYFVKQYLATDGRIHCYENFQDLYVILNYMLRLFFDFCREIMNGCKVIAMPSNNLGNEQHIWGKFPLHYHDLYYEYVGKSVELIVDAGDENESRLSAELNRLKLEYNNKLRQVSNKGDENE